jgi:uncharacterized protein YdaU (DUF1376 family)
MGKAPAFQFYVNDWLSSTHIMLMTPAQEGAYIHLLAIAWNSDDCGLPSNDNELAVLSRLGEAWFNGNGTVVKRCFKQKGTRLYNERLLQERKKQDEWREKSRQGGIKSGKLRSSDRLDKEGCLKGGLRVVEPKGNSSFSSSSSSSSKRSFKTSPNFSEDSDEIRLSKLLFSKIQLKDPKAKVPKFDKWAREIDLMIRIDKRTVEEIELLINWCQEDNFWCKNILSTGKLREKFTQLLLKFKSPISKGIGKNVESGEIWLGIQEQIDERKRQKEVQGRLIENKGDATGAKPDA